MDLTTLINNPTGQMVLLILTAWSLIWKGFALWKAAKNSQRNWFIAILVLNTFGILEIVYLFYFKKPKKPENAKIKPEDLTGS